MSNIGYREILDFGALSLKQLNDNLRALWGKVMGEITYRDLAGDAQEIIQSKADQEELSNYSTLEQTDTKIEAAVTDLNLSQYSTVTQTASAIESAVTNLNLDQYSTITQTALAITSAVSGKADQSDLQGLSSTVQQLQDRVSVKLRNDDVNEAFEARVAGDTINPLSESTTEYGITLHMLVGNEYVPCGGLFANSLIEGYGLLLGSENKEVWLTGSNVAIYGGGGANAFFGDGHAECNCDLVASTGNTHDLGRPSGYRWRRLYCNVAPDVSSDARLKKDIAPLCAGDLIDRLIARQFRMKDDARKLHFGFIAQEVREALGAAGIHDADLLDEDDPESLGLVYDEIIAVLVDAFQKVKARMDDCEARLARLEALRA